MLGWIGNIFLVTGLWGIGSKYRRAFLLSIVGESLWIANALSRSEPDWALAFICVVFGIMAVRGYILWGEE
jgi:hypothetical protein